MFDLVTNLIDISINKINNIVHANAFIESQWWRKKTTVAHQTKQNNFKMSKKIEFHKSHSKWTYGGVFHHTIFIHTHATRSKVKIQKEDTVQNETYKRWWWTSDDSEWNVDQNRTELNWKRAFILMAPNQHSNVMNCVIYSIRCDVFFSSFHKQNPIDLLSKSEK